jgi:hypothetical protein
MGFQRDKNSPPVVLGIFRDLFFGPHKLPDSKKPLLLFRMKPVSNLLGDKGGIAAGAVVDN